MGLIDLICGGSLAFVMLWWAAGYAAILLADDGRPTSAPFATAYLETCFAMGGFVSLGIAIARRRRRKP